MLKVVHVKRAHALLSPSGASRWLNCTPSARIEEEFPEEKTSTFAEEGTLAHEFAELELSKLYKRIKIKEYKSRLAELKKHALYTGEMDDYVATYVAYVSEEYLAAQRKTPDAVLLIEEKTDLTEYIQDGFGTCDAVIISDGTMEVIDKKYGKGIRVDAEDNDQLKLYGLGAYLAFEILYDITTIKLTIVQTRLNHISSWEISVQELLSWGAREVRQKAKLAYKGEGIQQAGNWCKWCKAAPRCATLAAANLRIAKHNFKGPHLLTDDQLTEVYSMLTQISDWAGSVSGYMLSEAIKGKIWRGFKIVEGRSMRKWRDEDLVKKFLSNEQGYGPEDILNTKMKGIGDIEKLVGKKEFPNMLGSLVVRPPGKPALVPMSDKRREYNTLEQAKQDFK